MNGTQFKEAIQPQLDLILQSGKEELEEAQFKALENSLRLMYGEGYIPPECFVSCVLSSRGYKPGVYESLPVILPRYFAADHEIVKAAFDAVCAVAFEVA